MLGPPNAAACSGHRDDPECFGALSLGISCLVEGFKHSPLTADLEPSNGGET